MECQKCQATWTTATPFFFEFRTANGLSLFWRPPFKFYTIKISNHSRPKQDEIFFLFCCTLSHLRSEREVPPITYE